MSMDVHEYDTTINDLQMSPDRTYFITAGKDKTAKVRIILSCISILLILSRSCPLET